MRSTHTFAVLEVSEPTFREIAQKLREAGYAHAFVEEFIDMHGIAVACEAEAPRHDPKIEGVRIATTHDGRAFFDFGKP